LNFPDENLLLSRAAQQPDETIFSSGASRVTGPDELIKIVQYTGGNRCWVATQKHQLAKFFILRSINYEPDYDDSDY
jgi:hypothetical protein